jgi:hypothetical protein
MRKLIGLIAVLAVTAALLVPAPSAALLCFPPSCDGPLCYPPHGCPYCCNG